MDAKEALKVYFGFDSYKEGQETAITAVLIPCVGLWRQDGTVSKMIHIV